jgi:hypothetical protein
MLYTYAQKQGVLIVYWFYMDTQLMFCVRAESHTLRHGLLAAIQRTEVLPTCRQSPSSKAVAHSAAETDIPKQRSNAALVPRNGFLTLLLLCVDVRGIANLLPDGTYTLRSSS